MSRSTLDVLVRAVRWCIAPVAVVVVAAACIPPTSGPPNQAPVAVAGASETSGYFPLEVEFSADGSHDPDGTTLSYEWDFGTGDTSTDADPSYVFDDPGVFEVTLRVRDSRGATTTAGVTVEALARQPEPEIAPTPAIVIAPRTVVLSSTGSSDPNPGGAIESYLWDFGGGATSTEADPTYVFQSSGTKTISLTVTNNYGVSATTTRSVQVTSTSEIGYGNLQVTTWTAAPDTGNGQIIWRWQALPELEGETAVYNFQYESRSFSCSPTFIAVPTPVPPVIEPDSVVEVVRNASTPICAGPQGMAARLRVGYSNPVDGIRYSPYGNWQNVVAVDPPG